MKDNTTQWDHERTTVHASDKFEGVTFVGTMFRNVEATNVEFVNCDFRNVHLGLSSKWTKCTWRNCRFSGRYATFGGPSQFRECRFVDTTIDFVDFSDASFADCVFSGELKNTVLRGPDDACLEKRGLTTSFTNVDISDLCLEDVYIRRGFDLSTTKLPTSCVQVFNNEGGKCVEAMREAMVSAGEARSGMRVLSHDMYAAQDPLPICDSTIETYFRTESGRKQFWAVISPYKAS